MRRSDTRTHLHGPLRVADAAPNNATPYYQCAYATPHEGPITVPDDETSDIKPDDRTIPVANSAHTESNVVFSRVYTVRRQLPPMRARHVRRRRAHLRDVPFRSIPERLRGYPL